MLYIKITSAITTVLSTILTILTLEYMIVLIVGLFSKKIKYPEAKEKLRYGVVISARNEKRVIAQLIESIRKSNYPQDKIDVFVMAHNCTDDTAKVARECGYPAYVYEYNNDKEKTKGYSLRKLFTIIDEQFGIKNYAGFHIFDADNILDKEYFNKMNDAFTYFDKKNIITSFRNTKNFGANAQTACYGLMYVISCPFESRGRMALNASARIVGSGVLISSELLKNGWNFIDISEDTDLGAQQVASGYNVKYCDEAMYYDEHPTKFRPMCKQRTRWAKGGFVVFRKRFKELFLACFGKGTGDAKPSKFSAYDYLATLGPLGMIGIGISLLDIIFKLFIPLFGVDPLPIWKNWAIGLATGLLSGYLFMVLLGIICYIKEGKRIKNASTGVKIRSVFVLPIFLMLFTIFQMVAMFQRDNFRWDQTDHVDQADFSKFNDESEQIEANAVADSINKKIGDKDKIDDLDFNNQNI